MRLKSLFLLITYCLFTQATKASISINLADIGGVGDGITLNTAKIQLAIDSCNKTGGGTIVFPKGNFLTGTIVLRSNVTLHLEADAVLLGSTDLKDYKFSDAFIAEKNPYADVNKQALIYAFDAKNIAVTGPGTIDGQGKSFETVSRLGSMAAFRGEVSFSKIKIFRPRLIEIIKCTNINFSNISIKNSPSWGLHLIGCDLVYLHQINLDSHVRPNNDGLDIESCKNVMIANCSVYSDDDGICFKSSIPNMPVENVVVTNCIVRSNCSGIKFGVASVAGFKNIAVSNCTIHDCAQGAIKFMAVNGGTTEDITISNIAMHNVEGPIFMRLGDAGKRDKLKGFDYSSVDDNAKQPIGKIKNVRITGITATLKTVRIQDSMLVGDWDPTAVFGILITGIPGYYIENVTLSDMQLSFPGGGTKAHAKNEVPENETMYPEQHFFKTLPAYGAYIRHAKGISLNNIRFTLQSDDYRPAIVTKDVENLELFKVSAEVNPSTEAIFRLIDTKNVLISNARSLGNANALLKVEGKQSGDILLMNNDLRKIAIPYILDKGMDKKVIVVQ